VFIFIFTWHQNVHVHEECESIRFAYLYATRNSYILAKRAQAQSEGSEVRRGSARNELRESTRLKWLQ
jgi:hypothetical protein